MNNLNTRIILINQYFRLFFKLYTPPNSNLYICQFSRTQASILSGATKKRRCVRLHCSATIHSVCVQSAFAPKYSGAVPVPDYAMVVTVVLFIKLTKPSK